MAGGTPLGQMYIELGLDASKFSPTLAGARNAVKYFQSEMRGLDTILKRNGNNMQALSAKSKSLQEAIKAQKKIVEGLKKSYDEADTSAKKDRYATQLANAKAKLQDFQSQLKSVNENIKTSNARMRETGKVDLYQKAKTSAELFESKLRTLDTRLQANGNNLALLAQKNNLLKESYKNQQRVLVELRKAQKLAEPNSPEWDKAAIAIENETARLHELKAELSNVGEEMKKVARENSLLFKAGQGFEKWGQGFQTAGDKLQAMGNAMRPLSTILSGGLTLATKNAIDFESQMNTTKSLLADTIPTAKELNATTEKLGSASKGWAKQYGISTKSINEGMQEIIKKGFDANQTMAAMPAILDASKASGDDFNVVMNASTNILRQFGLEAKDTNRVTDSLTYVANKTSAGFSDMGLAMEYVGPVAHSLNMSLEETSAAIGILSDNGIAGEKAGTALRGALSKLLKPSESNAAAMKELGFSVEEFQSGAIKLPDIIDRIKEATKGWTDEERASAIARAFGVEAQTGMNALINQGGDALRKLTVETKNAKGYTKKLADELSKSSKNGVERFKASLEVLGINIGQKLLPKLTPILDWANNMIDKFDKLDPKTQNWLTWLAVGLAGAYPGLNFLGNGLKIIGTASSGIGKTLDWLSKLKTARAASKGVLEVGDSIVQLGSSAGGAATKTSLLKTAVGALTSPLGLLVGGLTLATAGIVYLGNEKEKARIKAEEFGTALSDTARSELRDFQTKVDETSTAMANFGTHAGDADKVAKAFKGLYQEVADSAERANQRVQELAGKWGLTPEQVAKAQEHNKQIVSNTETMMNQINEIYQRHNGDASKFSAEEKEIILNNQREMISAKLELMGLSAKEQTAVMQALNGEINKLNETQLNHSKASLEKAMKEENAIYKQSKDELKELLDSKAITRQEYNTKMQQLESEHNQTMEGLGTKYLQVMQNLDAKVKSRTGQNWNYWEEAKKVLEDYGLSYEVIGQKAAEASQKMGDSHSILAKYTSEMSQETKEANDAWSLLVGNINANNQFEVKSNAKEVIGEAVQSAEGWEQLKLIAKNADINTNARVTMAEALVESGKWASMTLEEKQLIVNNQAGLQAIFDSESHLKTWNSMPAELKQLLMDNQDVMSKADVAKQVLESYNQLTPKQKELLAKDEEIRNAVARSTETLKNWDALTPFPKDLKANPEDVLRNGQLSLDKLGEWNRAISPTKPLTADSSNATSQGQAAINKQNEWNNTPSPTKPVTADSSNATSQGQAAINKQNEWNNTPSPTKNLLANNSNALSNQQAAIGKQLEWNGTPSPTKQINAQDNASSVISSVGSALANIPKSITVGINAVKNFFGFEKGTNYHTGGLAMVNDQAGPVYRELIQLPGGEQFIPKERNVMLDLPRGSKVFPAYKTKRLMRNMGIPKYAGGVGIPNDAKFIREMEQAQQSIVVQNTTQQTVVDMEKVVSEIAILRSSLEKLLTGILEKPLEVALDGEVLAQNSYQRQARIMAREGI